MTLRIAGIGSRYTPRHICNEMIKIGKWCRENKYYVTSGHAQGADYAFELGAKEYCLVYLPFKNFNVNLPIVGRAIIVDKDNKLDTITDKYHPNPKILNPVSRKLMNRNACQVLGRQLNQPVNFIVCWTDGTGGTQQALRIAIDYNIPILNMNDVEYNTAEKVINKIIP